MGNFWLYRFSPLGMGLVLAGLFLACEKSATAPEQPVVLREADVTGTWRTSVPALGFTVKVMMEIGTDHSLKFSQKYAGVVAGSPDSTLDRSLETGTWTLTNGILSSNKVACSYGNAPAYQLKDTTCAAPIAKAYNLQVNGNSMTVIEGTSAYVFTRD
jgi:hypothetical protein